MVSIETGVDKLVRLVAKEKKIELQTAAKELGVDPTVVQEWAEFLEEEGICGIQYSLSKTFIVERRLSKVEVEHKDKEYETRKEAFIRKVDSALKRLEDESAGFESIKKQYNGVKNQIGDEIEAVKEEIEQLRHYEELKRSIDQDILKQRVEYQKNLDGIHSRLNAEEKRYTKIIDEVHAETQSLEREHAEFSDIKKEEQDLLKRIGALRDIITSVTTKLEGQTKSVALHEERLQTLRTLAEKLHQDLVEKRKRELEPMMKLSTDQSDRILRIQEEIIGKIKHGRDKMQDFETQSKEIADRFERFFQRRIETERLIKEAESAKVEVQDGLGELIRKAKAFDLTVKGADITAHISQLEGQFHDYDKKRTTFGQKLEKLRDFIVGKGGEQPIVPPVATPVAGVSVATPESKPRAPRASSGPVKKKTRSRVVASSAVARKKTLSRKQ